LEMANTWRLAIGKSGRMAFEIDAYSDSEWHALNKNRLWDVH